ncbi:hypothetical protein ACHAXN_000750 [Cyclotella atomus]|jgi:hypothetical protein
MTKNWRETLFVWDGILSFMEEDDKEAAAGDKIVWEGTWVGVASADATNVETPKRGAFEKDVTSDNKFEVIGRAVKGEEGEAEDDADAVGGKASALYKAKMVDGSGYDLEGKKHKDIAHNVYFSTLRWKGNLRDQVENVVFALGENEFGNFISVGWLRVGNRVTMARRYIDEEDERGNWNINDLRKAVFNLIASTEEEDVSIVIPPWKCDAMNASFSKSSKRQKTEQ